MLSRRQTDALVNLAKAVADLHARKAQIGPISVKQWVALERAQQANVSGSRETATNG